MGGEGESSAEAGGTAVGGVGVGRKVVSEGVGQPARGVGGGDGEEACSCAGGGGSKVGTEGEPGSASHEGTLQLESGRPAVVGTIELQAPCGGEGGGSGGQAGFGHLQRDALGSVCDGEYDGPGEVLGQASRAETVEVGGSLGEGTQEGHRADGVGVGAEGKASAPEWGVKLGVVGLGAS